MRHSYILFLLPTLILVGFFIIFPIAETLRYSFCSWEGYKETGFAGVSNYADLFGDKSFINLERFPTQSPPYGALIQTVIWMAVFIPASVILGLVFAVLLRDVKGRSVIKSMIFLGMVCPMVVAGLVTRFMFQENVGIINGLLGFIGLGDFARTWTAFPDTALLSLILGSLWIWVGFAVIIYSAGLELIPKDLYEAANIDGASGWRIFRRITFPMLKSCTAIVVVMSMVRVVKIFDLVWAATMGGPGGSSTVLGLSIYTKAFSSIPAQVGVASAIAVLLILMASAINFFSIRRLRR